MVQLAAGFLLLSGIASLTYQVAWVRLLGLSMGSTSASISTVLAAFFMGLALGSYLAERITRNRINNLTVYIYLEVIIGLCGLALLPILLNLDSVMASMPILGTAISTKFAVTMLLLCIPTICMGATFPVMASILIRRHSEVGLRMSQLYSLNTAGAVLGAALAGFVFVPNWGLDGAVYIAFAINASIVTLGLYMNRRISLPPIEGAGAVTASVGKTASILEEAPFRVRALLVLFATGFVAIATEVGWTKYLSIFTGTTIYGFAAILTVFLIGIAVGSWAVKSYLQNLPRPELWMAGGLVLLGVTLLLTRAGLTLVPPIYQAVNHLPSGAPVKHAVKYVVVFMLIFPPTFIFGALFPLNLKLYCGNLQGVRTRIGKAYAVNTVASIFGSVAAGFWIIPQFGTDALLTAMAFIILLMPFVFVPSISKTLPRVVVPITALLAIGSSWALPNINYERLISSVQYDNDAKAGKTPTYLFLKEGKAGVISMVTYDGRHVKLQNNGLNESFIDLEDDKNVLLAETLLGLIPYFLHQQPKEAFVVGFGGGITTRALASTQKLESIKVVELEPTVVEAGRAIVDGEIAALEDPRVSLEFNDARNTLLTESKTYDVIAAQPSHPWVARASNVFTREFFQLVNSRLNEGGIYAQWVNLFNMDATTLRSIFKAFFDVFPHGMSFANLDTGDFLLFGANHELFFNYQTIAERMEEPKIKPILQFNDINKPQDLFWYFALSREEAVTAAGDIDPNTDTNIFSEVRLSMLDSVAQGDENPYDFLHNQYHLSVKAYLDTDVAEKLYAYALYLIDWDEERMTRFIAEQLKEVDEVLARGVEYELVWSEGDYEKAMDMYAQHEQWPDRTYYQQALALMENGKVQQARAAVSKIRDADLKVGTQARLLFEEQDWKSLAAVKPVNNEQRKWQLLGVAKNDLLAAGQQMDKIKHKVKLGLPQLKLLVKYYSLTDDDRSLAKYAKRLAERIDSETKRLAELTDKAIAVKSSQRAKRLLGKLVSINPEAEDIQQYKQRISELDAEPKQHSG
ncbi:MAG: fused MFS/spermidine synthase [Gammaproteobacteria bacterium]|jgi:spermidine synthase